jgi:hypothetical protein
MSQKEFQRVKVIENAAGGRMCCNFQGGWLVT